MIAIGHVQTEFLEPCVKILGAVLLWMTIVVDAAFAQDAAPPVAITVTTSTFTQAEAHNVAPVISNSGPATAIGSEVESCSNRPAKRSTSSAFADVRMAKNGDTSWTLDLMAVASAKGGKYVDCSQCNGQFCTQPGDTRATESRATSEVTATLDYKFGQLRGAGGYAFVIRPLDPRAKEANLAFRVKRQGIDAEIPLKPNQPYIANVKPNEEIIVNLTLKAIATGSDDSATITEKPSFKMRVDLFEAPILDASVNEGYLLRGKETTAYPGVGLLAIVQEDGKAQSHCTGTVIGNTTILTAAHCVALWNIDALVSTSRLLFVLGNSIDQEPKIAIKSYVVPADELPEKFKFNERPDSTLEDDVALLFTANAIGVQKVALYDGTPRIDELKAQGKTLVFVGFGLNPAEVGAGRAMGLKREADIPIANFDNRTFGYASTNAGASTCRGDSGGPAFMRTGAELKLVGVTSYGAQSCERGRSMRADFYSPWIARHTQ